MAILRLMSAGTSSTGEAALQTLIAGARSRYRGCLHSSVQSYSATQSP